MAIPRGLAKGAYPPNRRTLTVRGAEQEPTYAQLLIASPCGKGWNRGDRNAPRDARALATGHTHPAPVHRSRCHLAAPACAQHTPRRRPYAQRSGAARPPGQSSIRASVRITRMGDADLPRVTRGCLLGGTAACRLHLRGAAGRMRSAGHVEAGSRHGAAPMLVRWVREGHVPMNTPSTTHIPAVACARAGAVPVSA